MVPATAGHTDQGRNVIISAIFEQIEGIIDEAIAGGRTATH